MSSMTNIRCPLDCRQIHTAERHVSCHNEPRTIAHSPWIGIQCCMPCTGRRCGCFDDNVVGQRDGKRGGRLAAPFSH